MKRLSQWNLFTQKIFAEGKKKDPKYEFKDALQDASRRKGEMAHMPAMTASKKASRKSKKHSYKSKKSMRTRRRR